ncbi:MAG TPA: BrnA antitoxin family protein [bacterium]|nr:BrnA antitoxin family protein [bacterium]
MPKPRSLKPIPRFRSEAKERAFWATHDVTEFADFDQPREAAFPNLKLSTETISLRLPAGLLAALKTLANQRDVPYQSLLKVFLAERVAKERGVRRRRTSTKRSQHASARAQRPIAIGGG